MILPQQLGMAEYIMKTVRDFDAKSRIFREKSRTFIAKSKFGYQSYWQIWMKTGMKNGIRALSLILNQDFTPSPYTNEYNKASKLWFNVLPVCLTKQTQLPYWSGKQNKLTHQCHLCSEEKSQHLCFLLLSLGAVDRLLPLMCSRTGLKSNVIC